MAPMSPLNAWLLAVIAAVCLPGCGGGSGSASPPSPAASYELLIQLAGTDQAPLRVLRQADGSEVINKLVTQGEVLSLPAAGSYRVVPGCRDWQRPAEQMATFSSGETSRQVLAISYSAGLATGNSGHYDEQYLKAVGNQLWTRSCQPVQLRGVNLGGWLVPESWMNGYANTAAKDTRFALEILEGRFGASEAARLMGLWQDNWITAQDLDQIKALGFNAVRVPFGWRNLQDAAGNWHRTVDGQIDFVRFDWIVAEAAKRGLYVIFDLHVWPSWKPAATAEDTTAGEHLLFDSSPEKWADSEAAREQAAALWRELALHFKGNGTVAGLDVVNEPTGSYQYIAHRKFYDTIRAADPERLLIMEWIHPADLLDDAEPNHPAKAWRNIMLSDHHYVYGNSTQAADQATLDSLIHAANHRIDEISARYPYYVGELKDSDVTYSDTGNNSAEWLARAMNQQGWHWTMWTYKGVNIGGWAIFNYYGALSVDLATASMAEIESAWGVGLRQWQDPLQPINYYWQSRQRNGYAASVLP